MSLRLRSSLAPSLGDQYERLAKRRQEQQAEEARVVARRRAEEALDVANINRFSEAELETVLSTITISAPTSPQRSIFPNAQNVAVELSAERPERPFQWGIESETSARDAMHASPIAENYADVDFNEPSVASDPEIQQLLHELSEVKESHKALERQLEQHKKEVLNLRKELRETEERRIQNPCDATTTQEYKNLRDVLRDCQSQRDELQNELDKLQERERELCQELQAARLRISNQTNEIVHLNERSRSLDGQLVDARTERDMHARTVEALQHQLGDLR
ncbi:MAG: hypothetical protein M1824_005894 [Vezdaea acicularis]|nr:MAG: hypothetical protein M1824_005894 [Vezdaea acicularis]